MLKVQVQHAELIIKLIITLICNIYVTDTYVFHQLSQTKGLKKIADLSKQPCLKCNIVIMQKRLNDTRNKGQELVIRAYWLQDIQSTW